MSIFNFARTQYY